MSKTALTFRTILPAARLPRIILVFLFLTVSLPCSDVSGQTLEINKFQAPPGSASTQFGGVIAMDDDTAVVTATVTVQTNVLQSVAFVYVRDGDNWVFQAQLAAADWVPNDTFGSSVAIDGDTVLIGSPSNSNFFGAVYAFVRTGTTWSQQAKFSCTDCSGPNSFGQSISLEGDTALIGSPQQGTGRAYIFLRNSGSWGQAVVLTPSDGAMFDRFGFEVVLNGDTLAIGSPDDDIGTANSQGSVYVFSLVNSTWIEQAKLVLSDGQANERVGTELALQDDTLAIGVPFDRAGAMTNRGSVRIFIRSGTSWNEQVTLLASDGSPGDNLGRDVRIYGNTLIASSPSNSIGTSTGQGSVYVFEKIGGVWIEISQLLASNGTSNGSFGSPAIGPAGILVGLGSQRAVYYYRDPVSPMDLRAESDSGAGSGDNITNTRNPGFDLGGLTPGSNYEIFRDGLQIFSGTASGVTAAFTDDSPPANCNCRYDIRKIVNGKAGSLSYLRIVFDTARPVLTINRITGDNNPTSASSVRFAVALSEPIVPAISQTAFSLSQSTANVSNATISITDVPPGYWVGVDNIQSDGEVRLTPSELEFKDIAGNTYIPNILDNVIIRDTQGPTVTIDQMPDQADPTSVLPVRYRVVFSDPVTGFNSSDLVFNDSTAIINRSQISITGSGAVYLVTLNGVSSDGGFIRLTVRGGAVEDAASNPSFASTSTDNFVIFDNTDPGVTINTAPGQLDPSIALPIRYNVVFSEAVTGFGPEDLVLNASGFNASTASREVTGSGRNYVVSIGNLSGVEGTLTVAIPSGGAFDAVGNRNRASTSTDNSVFVDTALPSVTVNQLGGQSDPTSNQLVGFTAIFSENVVGFTSSDISLEGSSADVSNVNIQIVGSGSLYNILVGNIRSTGLVRLTIPSGGVQDIRGNFNLSSTSTDNSVFFVFGRWNYDYDGDRKSDLSVGRPTDNVWYLLRGTAGYTAQQFGEAGDRMAPADYDGDGKTDVAVFRPSTGTWFVFASQTQTFQQFGWGANGDLPVPTDRDNDGKADLVVYRESNNTWYTRFANGTFATTQFGVAGDKPLVGDFDGDGIGDIALFRPSNNNWYLIKSSLGFFIQTWGEADDIPVPADYDGDGATDQAVFRPSTGQWFLSRTTAGFGSQSWGQAGDIPVAADYDGDGKSDVAVFRPSNGNWYIVNSTAGQLIQQFGTTGDIPTQSAYLY